MISAIRDTCRRAGEDPQLSCSRDELGSDFRSKVVLEYPYLVFFRPSPPDSGFRVQVIRILHQAQDVEAAFSEDERS